MKELSRTVVTKPAGSLSLLVLIDKNVQKLVNEEYYFSLRNKLVDYLKSTSGYEISFAGFAQNNPFMRKSFQPIFSGFKSSINDIPTDSLNFMFDVGTNGGTNNKYAALDSGLNYINKNAHYANKAILFVTDPNYNNADITLHNQLISKANTYNTSINIFDSYQSPDEYSFLKLSSQTGGMICNHVSSDVIASSFDLFVPALFDYLTGKKYYEWLIEVKTDKDFFNKVTWALFYSRLKLYDGNSTEFNLIYEK
jgi:hypothetical protein